jgi:hypothetical protein
MGSSLFVIGGCIRRLVFLLQTPWTVPRRWRLDGLGASLSAHGAAVSFAFEGGFRAFLFAGSENVPGHRYPLNDHPILIDA